MNEDALKRVLAFEATLDQNKAHLREMANVFGESRVRILCDQVFQAMSKGDIREGPQAGLLLAVSLGPDASLLMAYAGIIALREAAMELVKLKLDANEG